MFFGFDIKFIILIDISVVLILDISFNDIFIGMFRMIDRCCFFFLYFIEKGFFYIEDYLNNSYICSFKFSCFDICVLKF